MEKIDVKKIVIENLQNHKDWEEYQERKDNLIYTSQKPFWEELLKKIERLEELEKENQELKKKLEAEFEDSADEICKIANERDKLLDENIELQIEIRDLKEKNEILNHNSTNVVLTDTEIMKRNLELQTENEKLKARCKAIPPLVIKNEKLIKAIEILKKKTELRIVVAQGQYLIQQGAGKIKHVSKEDGELLNEVFEE